MNNPIFKKRVSKKTTGIWKRADGLSATIHMVKNKDGSFVLRAQGSTPVRMKAGLGTISIYDVARRKTTVIAHRKVRGVTTVQTQIADSQVLAEESLEETQAIARHMEENLTRNGEFYQSLKRLVKS